MKESAGESVGGGERERERELNVPVMLAMTKPREEGMAYVEAESKMLVGALLAVRRES